MKKLGQLLVLAMLVVWGTETVVRAGDWMKIAVETSGVVRLTASSIAGALDGESEATIVDSISNGTLRLWTGTNEVAWLALSDCTGLCFHAVAQDSIYTRQTIYRLERGAGRIMGVQAADTNVIPVAGGFFRDTLHFEQDNPAGYVGYQTATNPEGDIWYWTSTYVAPGKTNGTAYLTNDLPGAVAGGTAGILSVYLRGGSPVTNVVMTHHGRFFLNGQWLCDTNWPTYDDSTVVVAVTNYQAVGNVMVIQEYYQAGDLLGQGSYIDSFDMTYDRSYFALSNRLWCTAGTNSVISVRGFTRADISVFDVTDPYVPAVLDGVLVDSPLGGEWRATFVPSTSTNQYLVWAGFDEPVRTASRSVLGLADTTNRGSYVVIAPASFLNGATELANYRAGQGLEVKVVELESVFDEFSHGMATPHAIRSFLATAYVRWAVRPEFAVLVGAGNLDYRNVRGLAVNASHVPCFMWSTPYGLCGVDNPMGDIDGDHVPEVVVGRLPVLDSNELAGVVAKIKAYEAAVTNLHSVHLVAGAADSNAGDFPATSMAVEPWMSPLYSLERNYLTNQLPMATLTANWLRAINLGRSLMTYVGHASDKSFGEGGTSLQYSNLDQMTNPAPPVLLAMACSVARFDRPTVSASSAGLAKQMVAKPLGGLTAVWGNATEGLNINNFIIGRWLVQALFQRDGIRLGTAMRQAYRACASEGLVPVFMLDTYGLLGDPALDMGILSGVPTSYELWKAQVFTPDEQADPAVSDPGEDADDDGMINEAEYIAGTNPKDSASGLIISSLSPLDGATGRVITWSSMTNRLYKVEMTTNLATMAFVPIASELLAAPPVNSYTDPVDRGTETVYYRITVEK